MDPKANKIQLALLAITLFCGLAALPRMVCEATDPNLLQWKTVGHIDNVRGECPNMFPLGDCYALINSTLPISYLVGDFDAEKIAFKPRAKGYLDYGYGKNQPDWDAFRSRGLYGTTTYEDDKGRRILLGWISGFKDKRGWNGCMSLPRVLILDKSGQQLIQTPLPELQELRGEHTRVTDLVINSEFKRVDGAAGNQLEIIAEFVPDNAGTFGLKLRSSRDGRRAITLQYTNSTLNVAGTEVPLEIGDEQKTLKLQVYLDRSVMEVFINDGRAAVTRVGYPGEEDLAVGVFAEKGAATVRSLDVWQMKSIWDTPCK